MLILYLEKLMHLEILYYSCTDRVNITIKIVTSSTNRQRNSQGASGDEEARRAATSNEVDISTTS